MPVVEPQESLASVLTTNQGSPKPHAGSSTSSTTIMGRGGELVETPESLAYAAKRTEVLKSGKISWEEVRVPLVGWSALPD